MFGLRHLGVRQEVLSAVIFVALFSICSSTKFPKAWKTCKKTDKNFNSCIAAAAQHAVKTMKDGFPALGMPPLDPLHLQTLQLTDKSGGKGPFNINLNFKDLDMHGIGSCVVHTLKADWDNYLIEGNVTFEENFVLQGQYNIKGRVLLLPILGSGKCNLTFANFGVILRGKGHEVVKGKHKYMYVDKFSVDLTTTRFHMQLDNLFNGDKSLSNHMNVFVNDNWRDILDELRPSISRNFGAAFKDVANRVLTKVPLDEISPK